MRKLLFAIALLFPMIAFCQITSLNYQGTEDTFNNHRVILDKEGKLLPWYQPSAYAYDQFLHQRWNFIKTQVPNAPGPGSTARFPAYYFFCAYDLEGDILKPSYWMNDIGEKIPNWFESARLYYTYTGDTSVMKIIKDMADYHLKNGVSPSNFSWPYFPFATADAGDSLYRGFTTTERFRLYETQIDHSGDIALAWLNLYLFYNEKKYLDAALKVADLLALKVRPGSLTKSPWPYIVNLQTGESRDEFGTNWMGCYGLLNKLADMNVGNVASYRKACKYVKDFLLQYPLQTGYWVDGHSDNFVNNPSYKSNLSKSNFVLYLFDNADFDSNWKKYVPNLFEWTEKYFIKRSAPGEPGNLWGADIVGEQDSFMYKMDYQTARHAAECARWFAVSGDQKFKDKAFRSLNFVTYCSDSNGRANESPLSKGISNWWSDCYGECPRMFYHVFAAIPEWAPPGENHILYSASILNNVTYAPKSISYNAAEEEGVEYIHVNFKPGIILLNKKPLALKSSKLTEGYSIKHLRNNDYAIQIFRDHKGIVEVK